MAIIKYSPNVSTFNVWVLKLQSFYELDRQCLNLKEAQELVAVYEGKGLDILINCAENNVLVYYLSNLYSDPELGDSIDYLNDGGIIFDPRFFREFPLSTRGMSDSLVHENQFVLDTADVLIEKAASPLFGTFRDQVNESTPISAIRQLFFSRERLRELYVAKDTLDFIPNTRQAVLLEAAKMAYEPCYKPMYREVSRDMVRVMLSDLEVGFDAELGFIELVSSLKDGRFKDGMAESLSYFVGGKYSFSGDSPCCRMLENEHYSHLILLLKKCSINESSLHYFGYSQKVTRLEPVVNPVEWGRYLAIDKYLCSHPNLDFNVIVELLRSDDHHDRVHLRSVGYAPKAEFDSLDDKVMADLLQQYAIDFSVDYVRMQTQQRGQISLREVSNEHTLD